MIQLIYDEPPHWLKENNFFWAPNDFEMYQLFFKRALASQNIKSDLMIGSTLLKLGVGLAFFGSRLEDLLDYICDKNGC